MIRYLPSGGYVGLVGPKTPSEVKVITFDFVDQLGSMIGATIIRTEMQPVQVIDGEDPDPQNLLMGSAFIDQGGLKVRQAIQGGVEATTYCLTCRGTDSNGAVHEIKAALLVMDRPVAWVVPN